MATYTTAETAGQMNNSTTATTGMATGAVTAPGAGATTTAPVGFNQPTDQRGRTAYDIRREQVMSEAERERDRRQEALRRQMAAQGLSDSGIAIAQTAQMEGDLARTRQQGLSEIDVAQLSAQEQQQAAERQRQFTREERLGTQDFQATQAEATREFEESKFSRDLALRQDYLTFEQRQFGEQVRMQEAELAEKVRQFNTSTGLERERLAQEIEMMREQIEADKNNLMTQIKSDEMLALMNNDESARQFDARLNFDAQNALDEIEFRTMELGLQMDLEDRRLANDIQQNQARLNESIRQFNVSTGTERERLANEILMHRESLQNATDNLKLKVDAEKQLENIRATNALVIENASAYNQQQLASLNQQLEMGIMSFENTMAQKNAADEARAERYRLMGVSGEELSAEELQYLRDHDSLAYNSYLSGQAGKTADEVQQEIALEEKYLNAQIENLADLHGVQFQEALDNIYRTLGYEDLAVGTPQYTGPVEDTPSPEAQTPAQRTAFAGNLAEKSYDQILTADEYNNLANYIQSGDVPTIDYNTLPETTIWTTKGPNRWTIPQSTKDWVDSMQASNQIVEKDGQYYRIEGYQDATNRHDKGKIILTNVRTGERVDWVSA